MKRFVISMYVCCCAVFCSCSDDDKLPDVRPAAKGEYTDVRDGNTYGWVRIGDLEWMTENLKYQVGGLPYYECTYDVFGANYPVAVRSQLINTDFEADYETYGNFYTWQEAVESCPEGWRLPTDEDWKNLEMALVLRGVPDISRYGAARLTDGLLTAFNEKNGNTGAGTINGGVYLMKRALLDEIPEGKVSLENECIPRWMQEGRRLGGIVNDGYFIDIGVPEDYFRFQENVRKGDITW